MRFLILVLSLVVTTSAYAEAFVAVYTDNETQLAWGKRLPEILTNGCTNAQGQFDYSLCTVETHPDGQVTVDVNTSVAAQACLKFGARLPTRAEYSKLIETFGARQTKNGPVFTKEGAQAIEAVFGDMIGHGYWTADVLGADSRNYGHLFSAIESGGANHSVGLRWGPAWVRCVMEL